MECKEFEKLIPEFLDNKLGFDTLEAFYKHREECNDCKDELEIRYLVAMGISRLEAGDTFDLQKELKSFLEQIDKRIRKHKLFYNMQYIFEGVFSLIIIFAIIWIMS